MPSVLPDPAGLDIQNVIYSYRIQKETGDFVSVYVQNENANGTGYIFRERDDWLPGSLTGTQINKAVPVGNLPRALWGPGSIEVDGVGGVYDASVVYTYKVTPCFDPQFDPNCPGYTTPVPDIYEVDLNDLYDATKDENIDLERQAEIEYEELQEDIEREKKEAEEEKKRKYRLEKAMSTADLSALFAENQRIASMNSIIQTAVAGAYIVKSIPGGTYNDTVTLVDSKILDSQSGLRNGFAQQLLHQEMVDMQYDMSN
jgi:hypothetical protein|tara:strand:+ start:2300 stop:3073 length:774 start_codon:yes stop_codon:yes gene_type:complete